ncbi:MAG: M24 family metallopeptidase [archaeon]|nr:M24 family metallopeptidase [archaeon]
MKDLDLLTYEIFKIKEKEELDSLATASLYACQIMKLMSQKFEDIIDQDKKMTHQKIIEDLKARINKPDFKQKLISKHPELKETESSLELSKICIQSGGNYTPITFPDSDTNRFKPDIIICKSWTYYNNYHGKLIRTYIIEEGKEDKDQQKYYKILLDAFTLLTELMQPGKKISDIYSQVKENILSQDASLESKLPKIFGYETGNESMEEKMPINEKNETVLEEGMAFVLDLSLNNLSNGKMNYCLEIADTFILPYSSSLNKNLTISVSKSLSDIVYNFEEEESEEISKESKINRHNMAYGEKDPELEKAIFESNTRVTRSQMNRNNAVGSANTEERRKHQLALLEAVNKEFRQKITNKSEDLMPMKKEDKVDLSDIHSYDKKEKIPEEVFKKFGHIFIDKKNFTIFLPILKTMVPFHISLIKNTSKSEDNRFTVLRINFKFENTANYLATLKLSKPVILRDISFRSKDPKMVNDVLNNIKDLMKVYKQKEQEMKELKEIYVQEALNPNVKGKRIILRDVNVKPSLSAKKSAGTLEAHLNGFRFLSTKGEKQDILYNNIKHAFLQTSKNEMVTLIHLHLKKPILVAKKKTYYIQFYKESGVAADDIDIRRRGNDYEEYEMELKEQDMREKINLEFIEFAKATEQYKYFEFDMPFTKLQFTGVPNRGNVTIYPTKYCLVSLSDAPAFVITLSEINIAYFERVASNVKYFDLSLVFRDLSKLPHRITAIPVEYKEMIKEWLDENNIFFAEGLINVLWQNVYPRIKGDPEGFLEEGGWSFLLAKNPFKDGKENFNNENVDNEDEDNGDSAYEESEYSEESEDDDEYDAEEEEEEEESEYEGESQLSEKGLSWEEMFAKGKEDDKEYLRKHREEEDRKRGKKKK